jgi:hypothetical protein
LVAQVEALTPDAIRAGMAASLSDVRTLPIDWAQGSIVQARQETYLSFSLFLMKHPGAAVNSAFIEQQYTAFRKAQREQTVCTEETVSKNWFSNHPLWLPVLWKHAGVPPATNTQEFRSCAAAWKRHRSHVYELLQGSTDWLKAVSNDPSKVAAAAQSAETAIGAADSNWPLFGTEVDVHCLLEIIPDSILLLQHTNISNDPTAKICFETVAGRPVAAKKRPCPLLSNTVAEMAGQVDAQPFACSWRVQLGPLQKLLDDLPFPV